MTPQDYIQFLNAIEKLKCNTRHSWTSNGRQESIAEHSWRLSVMAMLCSDEYPHLDISKVIKMCLIHDLGEAVTGDIPAFAKTKRNELDEKAAIRQLLSPLPKTLREEFTALFVEMEAMETEEAKLYKSLDNLEALISHNEADIASWLPQEYELNLTYGQQNCEWSPWTRQLREQIKQDTLSKIKKQTEDY